MGWVQRDLHRSSILTTHTSSIHGACSKPHLTWPWTLPGMGHPHLLQTACSTVSPHLALKFFPYVQSKSVLFQFKILASSFVTTCPGKKILFIFPKSLLEVLEGCNKVFPEPFLFQAEQSQLPVFLHRKRYSSSLLIFMAVLGHCSKSTSFLGPQSYMQHSKWGLMRERITSLDLATPSLT